MKTKAKRESGLSKKTISEEKRSKRISNQTGKPVENSHKWFGKAPGKKGNGAIVQVPKLYSTPSYVKTILPVRFTPQSNVTQFNGGGWGGAGCGWGGFAGWCWGWWWWIPLASIAFAWLVTAWSLAGCWW